MINTASEKLCNYWWYIFLISPCRGCWSTPSCSPRCGPTWTETAMSTITCPRPSRAWTRSPSTSTIWWGSMRSTAPSSMPWSPISTTSRKRYDDHPQADYIRLCSLSPFPRWFAKCQKKHQVFRATLPEIHLINVNYILIQISYSTPYEAHLKKWLLMSPRRKFQWNHKR